MYEFVATNTGPIEIRARAAGNYGADALLRAFDADGKEIASSDNSSNSMAAGRLQIHVVEGRTYYFLASSADNSGADFLIQVGGGFARVARGDVLRIDGDDSDNMIRVIVSGSEYKVFRDGTTLTFDRAEVARISIAAKGGNDSVALGSGVIRTTVHGEDGDDTLIGGDGDDILIGYAGRDSLHGSNGNDTLYGNEGEDVLDGGAGDDRVVGGSGRDTIRGSDGDDVILAVDRVRDLIYGGRGIDSVEGDSNDYQSKVEELLE